VPRIAAVPAEPDPLAEVGRLRDPAGPWLHLLWGAPADARQFGWLLAGEGLASRVLRGPSVRTTYGLYDEAAAALQFPGDLVPDWPAFVSLLRDLSWLPGPAGQVLVLTRASLLLAAEPAVELASFVSAVVTVATERAGRREPSLHVVLADDAVGLAVLRARLQAIPAGVRDVVGWLPEEPAVARGAGGRATFRAGSPVADACDEAVVAALRESMGDDVVEIRRAAETYHGPPSDPVRTYGVVLADLTRAVAAATVVGTAAAAVPAACVMLPVPADPDHRGDREASYIANSTRLWPPRQAHTVDPPAAVPDRPPAADAPVDPPAPRVPDPATAPPAAPDLPDPAAERVAAIPDEPGQPAIPAPAPVPDEPADSPDVTFALVAADLEWEFAQGSPDHDPVDDTLVASAEETGLFVALFRTWTRDPAAGWVRVLVGYATEDADAARSALITAAQAGGARRTCVEVVAQGDVSDVHRWLERQCITLWAAPITPAPEPAAPEPAAPEPAPPEPAAPEPAAAERVASESVASESVASESVASESVASESAASESVASESVASESAAAEPAAAEPAVAESAAPEPATAESAAADVPAEAAYRPAPAEPTEAGQRLIDWATTQPGVVAVVAATTEDDHLTYAVVVDATTAPEAVQAGATQALADTTATVLTLAPSAGLSPPALKLYRASTRLWTKPTDRPTRATADTDPGPRIDLSGFKDTIERTEVEDETVDDFTLYALALTEPVSEDPPGDPDDTDNAIVAWAKEHPNLLAAARGTVTTHDTDARVYLFATDQDADAPDLRRAAARIMADHNHSTGAVEVFCPLDPIPRFYIDIYRQGLQLWRSDRKLTPREPPTESA
jgi:hypothetical protein